MSRRTSEHSIEERFKAVNQVIDNGYSLNSVASEDGIDNVTLKSWIRKYKADGIDGLKESTTWKRYSNTLKVNAVQAYLSGDYSTQSSERSLEPNRLNQQFKAKKRNEKWATDVTLFFLWLSSKSVFKCH